MIQHVLGKLICIVSLFTFLCLCGCSSTPPCAVRSNLVIPPLENQPKIPMRAAIYEEPALTKLHCLAKFTVGQKRVVFVGDSLKINCENMMKNIFRDVVTLSPSNTSMNNIDVIVTPRLKSYDYSNQVQTVNDLVKIQMTFEWNIVSPSGKQIYVSPVKSEASGMVSCKTFASTLGYCYKDEELGEVYAKLIEDQCRKAQQELYSAQWWKDPWWITTSAQTAK